MQCEMPGITREMIDWWFWWHAQESLRYKIWLPGEHLSISTRLDDADYFEQPFTGFQANTQYPVAMSGKRKAEFTIKYVAPTDFGFDQSLFKENNIETIVCGHVGLLRGRLALAEMAHIFKNTSDGLLVMSRYWIGEPLPFKNRPEDSFLNKIGASKTIKQKIFTEEKAYNTAEHCCREFRRLAKILPDLYEKYATTN